MTENVPVEDSLHPDQAEVAQAIIDFYNTPGQTFFCLEGWQGVGKTFTIQRAIKSLQAMHPRINVALTAPTNKAVKVLRSMALDYELNVLCVTIYSSLGLVLNSDGETKRTARMGKGNFEDLDLVVIDECSMLNRKVYDYIRELSLSHLTKVVFLGDRFQLPPVKEKMSLSFSQFDVGRKLTKNRRQVDGNPILELVESLRNDIRNETAETEFHNRFNAKLDQGVYVLPGADWYGSVKENFVDDSYQDDPDSMRCLTWTNKRTNDLNRSIRRLLVGETKEPFIPGERVLTRAPIFDDLTNAKPMVVANTDEELKVLDVQEAEHPLYSGMSQQFKAWNLILMSENNVSAEVYIVHEDSARDYKNMVDTLVKAAKKDPSQWRSYWHFVDSWAQVQPIFSTTIHRSQGSTFNNVWLDLRDCMRNRKVVERTQLLYVGASRASENLLILKG